MIIQISSGQGPAECELAVARLFDALKSEYKDIELISRHDGQERGCCTSILFRTEENLSWLEGTVQWICESPLRPHHKRKNWFVDVSIIPETEAAAGLDEKDIRFERFHCGGNGGQNVNKVETGVRLTHIPTGITVTSTAERTQLLNRNNAMKKLNAILLAQAEESRAKQTNEAWKKHARIVRGNPVRTYVGPKFTLKKSV